MNAGSEQNHDAAENLPDWADCDVFCIHGYAYGGPGNSGCGWRGRAQNAAHELTSNTLHCPRCGCASLLAIPTDRADAS